MRRENESLAAIVLNSVQLLGQFRLVIVFINTYALLLLTIVAEGILQIVLFTIFCFK